MISQVSIRWKGISLHRRGAFTQNLSDNLMAPTNNFGEDPYLVGISPEALQVGVYKRTGVVNNTSFGLPLVSCWRSFPTSMEEPYRMLISKIASCLETKEAQFYPFDDLHVTIATFRSLLDPNPPTTYQTVLCECDGECIKKKWLANKREQLFPPQTQGDTVA